MNTMEVPVEIKGFSGLNIREPAGMIQDSELSECINFDIGRAGELIKRPGFSALQAEASLGNYPVKIIGHFNTPEHSQILVQAGPTLYYTDDGTDYTSLGDWNVEYGVQYVDRFYMVQSDGLMLRWNGQGGPITMASSPSGTFVTVFKDRLYVIDSNAEGTDSSKLTFSDIIVDPNSVSFPSDNSLLVFPGDGDFLTCLAVVQDVLLVFKGTSTHILYVEGLPTNWERRVSNTAIGCMSKYTPKEIEGWVYFVSAKGVYRTDGTVYESISDAIQPLFTNRIVNLTTANTDSAAWWDDKYIVLLQITPSNKRYFVFHLRTQSWTEWKPSEGFTPGTFVEVHSALPTKGLYCGDIEPTGKTFRFGDGNYTDSGQEYECCFRTKDFDLGVPAYKKRGKWISVDVQGEGTMKVTHTVDQQARNDLLANSETDRRAVKIAGPGYFRTWNLSICLISNAPFALNGLTVIVHSKSKISLKVT